MKKQNLVLVKQSIRKPNSNIYKWVTKKIAKIIIKKNNQEDISYTYAPWYMSLIFRMKYYFSLHKNK
ncbi:hypothetical protein [Tenacibaculum sp. C7A-26P2]|uniref:hypothetical protein n=1 Tax=Tenacibaculum sp. C7A-26P2 TaxID=3447504 RepID=UPI003F855B5A